MHDNNIRNHYANKNVYDHGPISILVLSNLNAFNILIVDQQELKKAIHYQFRLIVH